MANITYSLPGILLSTSYAEYGILQIGKVRHRVLLLAPSLVTERPGPAARACVLIAGCTAFQMEAFPQRPSPLAPKEAPAGPLWLLAQPAQPKGPLMPGRRRREGRTPSFLDPFDEQPQ